MERPFASGRRALINQIVNKHLLVRFVFQKTGEHSCIVGPHRNKSIEAFQLAAQIAKAQYQTPADLQFLLRRFKKSFDRREGLQDAAEYRPCI